MAAEKPARKSKTSTPKKTRPPTRTAKWIRNLRNHPVHLRLKQEGQERPFFVQLQPRGSNGDAEKIPAKLTDTREFADAVYGQLVEIVTETEHNKTDYPHIGYLQDVTVKIVRDEDTVVSRSANQDQAIQQNPRAKVVVPKAKISRGGPTFVEMPGSMPAPQALTDGHAPTADEMIPAGEDVTSRKVVIERRRA